MVGDIYPGDTCRGGGGGGVGPMSAGLNISNTMGSS